MKEQLAALGLTVRRTGCGSEVVVRVRGSAPGAGYFTEDLLDALDTGRAMAAEHAARMAEAA